MTLEQLHTRPEYLKLTPKQKKFINAYLSNGYDAPAAALSAYSVKEKNARVQAQQVLGNSKIKLCIATYEANGPVDDKAQYLMLLWEWITSPKEISPRKLEAMS